MLDLDNIDRCVVALRADTEAALIEMDRKASTALVLERPVAVEMTAGEVRAMSKTVRSMLRTIDLLSRALRAGDDAQTAQLKQIAFLTAQGEEDRRQVAQALELIRDIEGMSFWQLRRFQREFKRRRTV